MLSWETATFGSALAKVLFPQLGIVASLAGGIILGGTSGYLLDKLSPSPKKKQSLNTLN